MLQAVISKNAHNDEKYFRSNNININLKK